ncbi:ComEC/Rec2 family competence protein [Brevibacillus fluminis]|uniref:ComEC/Rec2 family competence protein n=1 Tax=Brevibacillus fluminis TaxID=511487 RepID=UPI003F8BF503
MAWFNRTGFRMAVLLLLLLVPAGCSIDHHVQKTIKTDDPKASESEEQFRGLIINFFQLPDGESSLVRLPNGKTMLIDTGSEKDAPMIVKELAARKITRIDYLVLTNDLPNHTGGYGELAKAIQIDSVLLPKLTAYTIKHAVPLGDVKQIQLLAAGDTLPLDQGISLFVLNPTDNLHLAPQDNSLVFRLTHKKMHVLFTSGIGQAAEEQLLMRDKAHLPSEILKVGEQGSNQSTSQPFLQAVDPQVAVIQTGKSLPDIKNDEAETLERLHESWTETYLTSQNGTITIFSSGDDYRVKRDKKGKGARE